MVSPAARKACKILQKLNPVQPESHIETSPADRNRVSGKFSQHNVEKSLQHEILLAKSGEVSPEFRK